MDSGKEINYLKQLEKKCPISMYYAGIYSEMQRKTAVGITRILAEFQYGTFQTQWDHLKIVQLFWWGREMILASTWVTQILNGSNLDQTKESIHYNLPSILP
jgi:hypothetical protein